LLFISVIKGSATLSKTQAVNPLWFLTHSLGNKIVISFNEVFDQEFALNEHSEYQHNSRKWV